MTAPVIIDSPARLSLRERVTEFFDLLSRGYTPAWQCRACRDSITDRCGECSRLEALAKLAEDAAAEADKAATRVRVLVVLVTRSLRIVRTGGTL